MRVLLAGGTHFIGRSIVARLADDGHEVTVLNRGSSPAPAEAAARIVADRTDATALRAALREAGQLHAVVDVSGTEPLLVDGLLEALGVSLPDSYVFISSAAVYSGVPAGPRREDEVAEGDPVWGGYAEAKAACEIRLRAADLPRLTILRPPYVYGPDNPEDRERWLWSRMVHEQRIFVPRTRGSRIQLCHVSHLADVVAAAVAARIPAGTYNVGDETAWTFDEHLEMLAEICGSPARVHPVTDPKVPARSYFPFRDIDLVLDTTRLRQAGIGPARRTRDGLAETWAWLQRAGVPPYLPTPQEAAWLRRLRAPEGDAGREPLSGSRRR